MASLSDFLEPPSQTAYRPGLPPTPEREDDRLSSLRELGVLDTAAERALDDLALLASQILDTPIAAVSLVDGHRQFFKARVGLDASETPRDIAFCAHAICEPDDVFVVEDAHGDKRFADNPLVTGPTAVRFYAGSPIVLDDGHAIGVLCVNDRRQRRLTEAQLETLRILSRQAALLFDYRRERHRLSEAKARRDWHRLLLDRVRDAVCLVGADGRIEIANRVFDARFGAGHHAVGRGIANVLLGPGDPDATAALAARVRCRESFELPLPRSGAAGSPVVETATFAWQPDPLGEPSHCVVIVPSDANGPAQQSRRVAA